MATCSVNDLLASNPCMAVLDPFVVAVVTTQLWCDVSGQITPVPPVPRGSWFNPDVGQFIQNADSNTPVVNPDV